ncbi:MAG: ABC transporter substrate-binding protein, partial [Desulfobaccales bacterium]
FIRAYKAKYGKTPEDVCALTYDAMGLVLTAIAKAGVLDRQKVRDALASIERYEGVTGIMKFHGTGDPIKSAVIIHVKDGKFKYYATVQP